MAFPRGNPLLTLRDGLGPVFDDHRFAPLFPSKGEPAEAVRSRIDWKYLLGLPLADAGFDSTVLSEFRTRLVTGAAETVLLDAVLEVAAAHRLLKAGGRQRTESTHVLMAARVMNRMGCVHETMRHALEVLSLAAPNWLLMHTLPHWAESYERRGFDERVPRSAEKRAEWVQRVGEDGEVLLAALAAEATPAWLRQLPAIIILRRVWIQQFTTCDGRIQWRSEREGIPPAARLISSPYDVDARYACKRDTTWTGYKAHLTETCDADLPRIITAVQTTVGPVSDPCMDAPRGSR